MGKVTQEWDEKTVGNKRIMIDKLVMISIGEAAGDEVIDMGNVQLKSEGENTGLSGET